MTVSQKVQIDTFDYGASLTAPTLGDLATGTTITDGTASTCNEQTPDSGVYIADFVGADASHLIPAGTYRLRTTINGKPLKRFVTFTGVDGEAVYAVAERAAVLDSAARVKLAADQPDYAPVREPELRGGLTLAESVDLLIAGIAGVNSQPDSDTEKFKFVDGDDAFTTTFDVSGNRASVVLH